LTDDRNALTMGTANTVMALRLQSTPPRGWNAELGRTTEGPRTSFYELAGLPEYWIVNLPNCPIEMHRDPGKTSGR
jgi:hypothetical protein